MARILIIDDDVQFRQMSRKMLEKAGYNDIEEAADGSIGMKLFRDHPFDIVITDIIMPDKDGIEIITELSTDYFGTKIIAISGGGRIDSQSYLAIAKQLGANRILEKPFTQAELSDAVQELLKE